MTVCEPGLLGSLHRLQCVISLVRILRGLERLDASTGWITYFFERLQAVVVAVMLDVGAMENNHFVEIIESP